MMKKIWALVLAVAVFATMTGCGKNSSNAEEAAVRDEIMSELSEEDKKEIREMQNDLNDEPTPGEENKEKEEFTADDFPCDPLVFNSKWSDNYIQIADVIVQEFHNVPITEVINSFENSKLKFKAFEHDSLNNKLNLDDEFPIKKDSYYIDMYSPDNCLIALCCSVDRENNTDKILKLSDAYFTCISCIMFYSPELERCAYTTKGIPTEGIESEYSYRDVDKLLDDNMVELKNKPFTIQFDEELKSYIDKEEAAYFYDESEMRLDLVRIIPSDIISGRFYKVQLVMCINDNNRFVVANISHNNERII